MSNKPAGKKGKKNKKFSTVGRKVSSAGKAASLWKGRRKRSTSPKRSRKPSSTAKSPADSIGGWSNWSDDGEIAEETSENLPATIEAPHPKQKSTKKKKTFLAKALSMPQLSLNHKVENTPAAALKKINTTSPEAADRLDFHSTASKSRKNQKHSLPLVSGRMARQQVSIRGNNRPSSGSSSVYSRPGSSSVYSSPGSSSGYGRPNSGKFSRNGSVLSASSCDTYYSSDYGETASLPIGLGMLPSEGATDLTGEIMVVPFPPVK
jgi:hypothetical protein